MQQCIYSHKRYHPPLWSVAYLAIVTLSRSTFPHGKTIDTCHNVVKLHCSIGVDTTLKIEYAMHNRHYSTNNPEPYICLVLKPQVEKTQCSTYTLEY